MRAVKASGSWWGFKPYQGRYFWEALGRTVLSYGCLVWQHSCRKKCIRDRLQATQRWGFLLMVPFRQGTPNHGLEFIFNCPPLEVYLAKMAVKAYFRTLQFAPFRSEQLATSVTSRVSHRNWIEKLITDQKLDHLRGPLDVVPLHRRWDRKFEVDYTGMHPDNPSRGTPDIRGVNIYMDGSKDKTSSGAGVAIIDGGQVVTTEDNTEHIYQYKRPLDSYACPD